jgi:hypothetical protein
MGKRKNMKSLKKIATFAAVIGVFISVGSTAKVFAADDTDLTQSIAAGSLLTDIRDASRVTVANPSFAMSATNFSFNCQNSTGTIGSNSQRLYVDNPDAADNGWTLTMAATSGATTLWQNGGSTQNFDFNDPSGCTDGGDADSRPGQLTVDASAGTLTADCGSCVTTNITKGSSTAYSQGATDSITLLSAAAGSDDIGRWYLTGVGVTQSIPAEQTVDSYSINMTVTATAS